MHTSHLQTFLILFHQNSSRAVLGMPLCNHFENSYKMDHVFESRWLIDEFSRLGFSITYDEVNRYKH